MPRWSPFEPYFWSLVEKTDECWWWRGDTSKGYGRVTFKGARRAAHRVAKILADGPPPDLSLNACHTCDNGLCVRPDHVFWGTQKDNMQDWTRKGKNRLVNEPELWSAGRHMLLDKYRRQASNRQRERLTSGRVISVRGSRGRIAGTCVAS